MEGKKIKIQSSKWPKVAMTLRRASFFDFFLTRFSIHRMLRDNTPADSKEMKITPRAARLMEKTG